MSIGSGSPEERLLSGPGTAHTTDEIQADGARSATILQSQKRTLGLCGSGSRTRTAGKANSEGPSAVAPSVLYGAWRGWQLPPSLPLRCGR